jgi:regulator of protease activity HflC (stomatin/prohibitin superfamily)
MYKQRDNEYYPPMTTDPSGRGVVSSAITAHTSNNNDEVVNVFSGSAAAAGSRKRGRDIRGLERFRSVVYGNDGFRRLHGMVARNPTLMYPPDGIEEAQARVAARQREAQEERFLQQQQQQQRKSREAVARGDGTSTRLLGEDGEEDVFAMFEERKTAEQHGADVTGNAHNVDSPTAAPSPSTLAALRSDEELAKYHHQQLDCFLRLLYEFNHSSFVKLPMEDTLQLLSRCGKEAVAHVVEYETQVRLQRQARIKELKELQAEKTALAQRRLLAEEAEQARLLAAAEQRQAELDLIELDPADDQPAEAGVAARAATLEGDSLWTAAVVASAVHQVHFASEEEKVKEEEDVKDTDMVEAVLTDTAMELPVVADEGDGKAAREHNEARVAVLPDTASAPV